MHSKGFFHGKCTYWNRDGDKKSEDNFKEGIREGKYTSWFTYGKKNKKYECYYIDGYRNGTFIRWNSNEIKIREGKYKDGKEDGLWTFWYENGQKEKEDTYKDGKVISSKVWNEDGSVKND